jgi:hypothetical protein
MLLRAIRDLQQGKDPPMFTRDPLANPSIRLVTTGTQVPPGVDWRTYVDDRLFAAAV